MVQKKKKFAWALNTISKQQLSKTEINKNNEVREREKESKLELRVGMGAWIQYCATIYIEIYKQTRMKR